MPPTEVLLHAAELETVLTLHGADVFSYERLGNRAVVKFLLNGVKLRLMVEMPNVEDYRYTPKQKYERTATAIAEEYRREVRRRWHALRGFVSAKLEAINAGVTTFEMEFRQFEAPIAELTEGEK